MSRLYILAAGLIAACGAVNAAQIEVGQYTSGLAQGLTASYLSGSSPCVGSLFQGNSCASASAGNWFETNYYTGLFASATVSGTNPVPYAGYSTSSTTAGSSISNSGENFAMINDTAKGTRNDWYAGTGASVFTVPVGLQGVTDVYMMLNNQWGVANAQDADIFFNFGTSSNVVTETVEVELTNSNTAAANSPSGQIQDSVTCVTGSGLSFTACSGFDGGKTAPTSNPTTVVNGSTLNTGMQVVTSLVYGSAAYTSISSSAVNYSGTTGTVQLNDLGFLFSSLGTLGSQLQNMYLVSVGVEDAGATGAPTSANGSSSDLVLSAITVDATTGATSATPEPSTWMLVLGGIGAFGIGRLRRRSS